MDTGGIRRDKSTAFNVEVRPQFGFDVRCEVNHVLSCWMEKGNHEVILCACACSRTCAHPQETKTNYFHEVKLITPHIRESIEN